MNEFLNRWQLAGMSSWDLPDPQGPNLSGIESSGLSRRGAESIKMEVPLSMKIPARFDLREIMTEIRSSDAHVHLLEWHQVLNQESKSSPGLRGFRQILSLRFFRDIVLPLPHWPEQHCPYAAASGLAEVCGHTS